MVGERQEQLKTLLDSLLGTPGVLGSSLVSRDGIPVISRFSEELEEMPFSLLVEGAMTATLMGAAEAATQEVGAGDPRQVIIETDKLHMVLVPATEDLLLVTLAEVDHPREKILEALRATTEDIAGVVDGP